MCASEVTTLICTFASVDFEFDSKHRLHHLSYIIKTICKTCCKNAHTYQFITHRFIVHIIYIEIQHTYISARAYSTYTCWPAAPGFTNTAAGTSHVNCHHMQHYNKLYCITMNLPLEALGKMLIHIVDGDPIRDTLHCFCIFQYYIQSTG